MKTDIATAVLAAIVGVVVSYIVVGGFLMGDPEPVVIKKLETIDAKVDEPNPEIFNYRAINPTVETYIDCKNYDLSGNCLKENSENQENQEGQEDSESQENQEGED